MLAQIKNRFRRAPAFAISVILLSAILAGSLCGLQAANKAEQRNYDKLWQNTPVKLIVTNLSATRRDNLSAPVFVFQAFNTSNAKNNLTEYVKDVRMKASLSLDLADMNGQTFSNGKLVGITDPGISGKLYNSGREQIKWFDGYSSAIFHERQDVCIVPESWLSDTSSSATSVDTQCSYSSGSPVDPEKRSANHTFTIIGTHNTSDTIIYCPFKTIQIVFGKMGRPLELDAIEATLINNDLQDEVREVSKAWFAEPNPTGAKTRWDYSWYFYYPYALDIDNDQLVSAERSLKTSMLVNEICAYLLFVLSACASFFVGFLMIRQRKKEIALMRTLGSANWNIFLHFSIEQIIYVVFGAGIGALPFLWQPFDRLITFIDIYVLGLCIALIIFLNSNLLSTLKEAD